MSKTPLLEGAFVPKEQLLLGPWYVRLFKEGWLAGKKVHFGWLFRGGHGLSRAGSLDLRLNEILGLRISSVICQEGRNWPAAEVACLVYYNALRNGQKSTIPRKLCSSMARPLCARGPEDAISAPRQFLFIGPHRFRPERKSLQDTTSLFSISQDLYILFTIPPVSYSSWVCLSSFSY